MAGLRISTGPSIPAYRARVWTQAPICQLIDPLQFLIDLLAKLKRIERPPKLLQLRDSRCICLPASQVLSLLVLRRMRQLTPLAYFLWTFGAYNLLNSGYLVTSAVLNSGDWANVIAGLSPAWLWRCVLGLAGVILYVLAMFWTASSMGDLVNHGEVALADLQHLVLPAYLAGGMVMTIASIFNPISPSLILLSGAGASFGLNSGLLFLPGIVAANAHAPTLVTRPMPFSFFWVALGIVVSGLFIAVLGPGIHFSN